MTYRELFYKAKMLTDNSKITLGEYEEMTKPLDREIEQEPVLDKIRAEIYNAIEFERKWLCDAGHTSKDIDIALNAIKSKVKDVLEKGAESEEGK